MKKSGVNIIIENIPQAEVEGNKVRQGAYYRNANTIVIDPRVSDVQIANTVLFHELAHSTEGTKYYDEFKNYIKGIKGEEFITETEKKMKSLRLSREEAESEAVADFVKDIFRGGTEEMNGFLSKDYTAAREITDTMKNIIDSVKIRFGVEPSSVYERAVRSFEKALAKRETGGEGIQFSTADNSEEGKSVKQQLEENADKLNSMEPVFVRNDISAQKGNRGDNLNWILKELGTKDIRVQREGVGEIILDSKRISNSLRYLKSDGELAAYAALPDVLKNGTIIDATDNHKGRNYSTLTIGAPVVINEVRGNVAAVVKQDSGKNVYKVHRILLPDGSSFTYEKIKGGAERAEVNTQNALTRTPADTAFNNSILENREKYNSNTNQNNKWTFKRIAQLDNAVKKSGVNIIIEDIFSGGTEEMNGFLARNYTAAREITDTMKNIIDSVKMRFGVEPSSVYERAVRSFEKALAKRETGGESGIQFSTAASNIYDYSKPFSKQIDDYLQGKIPPRDTLLVGGTPEVFQKIGFNALPITINQTHVDYALNGSKDADHALGAALLKQLPQALENPVAVFDMQRNDGRVTVLLDMLHNGKKVIVPIEIDGYGKQNGILIDSNAVVSMYGKNDVVAKQLGNAIKAEQNGSVALFYINKNKAAGLLQKTGPQLPGILFPNNGFIHSIREPGSKVKPKFENVTQSQQFKRWFGDWEKNPKTASKVVNEDGTPRIVYHGTDSNFTVFDIMQTGKNFNDISSGMFFFTKYKNGYPNSATDYARHSSENNGGNPIIMEAYLDIKKPLLLDSKGYYSTNEYYDINAENIYEKFLDGDYDGVIIENSDKNSDDSVLYVVDNSSQIKSATENIGTYDRNNPDIRYSTGEVLPEEKARLLREEEERRKEYGSKGGYEGHSMSRRAAEAYSSGEKPISKWTKSEILTGIEETARDNDIDIEGIDFSKLTTEELKSKFLRNSSWHHTGSFYNATDFYEISAAAVAETTQEDIERIISGRTRRQLTNAERAEKAMNEKALEEAKEVYKKIKFIYYSGVTNYKSANTLFRRYANDDLDLDGLYKKAVKKTGRAEDAYKIERVSNDKGLATIKNRILEDYEAKGGAMLFETREDAVIKEKDIRNIQSIPRKSVNDFTSADIEKTEAFARKYYNEMGNKSPFFRAWFGDWRENDTTPVKTVKVDTINLSEAILKKGDYYVADTDWTIHAGATLYGETRHYARGEKISVKALSAIKDILKNAVLLDTEISEKNTNKKSKNTAFMHKLYCPIQYNNKTYIAKVSVEEFLNPSNDIVRKAYHLQSIKIETADGRATNKIALASTPRSDAVSIDRVSQLFTLVKSLDKNFQPRESSKVVNEDGTPRRMYYTTYHSFGGYKEWGRIRPENKRNQREDMKVFTSAKNEADEKQGIYKGGIYLDIKNPVDPSVPADINGLKKFIEAVAEDKDYHLNMFGTSDAGEILKRIDTQNLLTALQKINEEAIGNLAEAVELYNKVNNTDFDGIIKPTFMNNIIASALYTSQIKSATENIGTYDRSNPDISYSTGEVSPEEQAALDVSALIEQLQKSAELLQTLSQLIAAKN